MCRAAPRAWYLGINRHSQQRPRGRDLWRRCVCLAAGIVAGTFSPIVESRLDRIDLFCFAEQSGLSLRRLLRELSGRW